MNSADYYGRRIEEREKRGVTPEMHAARVWSRLSLRRRRWILKAMKELKVAELSARLGGLHDEN